MSELELILATDIEDISGHDEDTMCATHVDEKWLDCACDKHTQKYNPVLGWFDCD